MICRECGKEIEKDKMFCSEECRIKYMDYLNGKVDDEMGVKNMLKQGDLLVYRSGNVGKLVDEYIVNHLDKNYMLLRMYGKDLRIIEGDIKFDIVKIFRPKDVVYLSTMNTTDCILIWEKKEEHIKITLEEIAKLKGVDVSRIRIIEKGE